MQQGSCSHHSSTATSQDCGRYSAAHTTWKPKAAETPWSASTYSLRGCFGFSSLIYKTFYTSHLPKSFFNMKPFSAHFPPNCRKLNLCFTTVCWFIYRRCSGYHFPSAFGTTFHKLLSHVTGHFWEFDQQLRQRYKTQRQADKSTMRFSVVRFDTIQLHLAKPTLITSTSGLFNNHLSSNFPSASPHLIPKIILLKCRKTSLELSLDRYTHNYFF